jgi:hypothetical protein
LVWRVEQPRRARSDPLEADLVRVIGGSTSHKVSLASDQSTIRELDIQPTIKVCPDWPVQAVVDKGSCSSTVERAMIL